MKAHSFIIETQIEAKQKQRKQEGIEKLKEVMKEYDITELPVSSRKTPSKVPAKYKNPNDPSKTWTGRGRKPKWVEELLEKGKTLESLAIR